MGTMIAILGCFVFLASATSGLVIGENVPVWVGSRPDPTKPVNYTMLKRGIVKEAIDEWRVAKPLGANDTKIYYKRNLFRRSSPPEEDDESLLVIPLSTIEPEKKVEWVYKPPRRSGRDVHILVVMDFPSSWPADEQAQQKYIKQKILHAIGFWNGMQIHLNGYGNYWFRIVGIVIGQDKGATPYVRNHETELAGNLATWRAAEESNMHWGNISKTNPDFPSDFRHVVFTMTESPVVSGHPGWDVVNSDGRHSFVYSGDGGRGYKGFDGKTLGPSLYTWSGLQLKKYDHLSPGKSIPRVPLPGQIISLNKQCQAFGWNADNFACFWDGKSYPCHYFVCANDSFWSACEITADYPLEGSYCGEGMMCWKHRCIRSSTMGYR